MLISGCISCRNKEKDRRVKGKRKVKLRKKKFHLKEQLGKMFINQIFLERVRKKLKLKKF